MAEINSRQAAYLAAGRLRSPAYIGGKKRVLIVQTPATHTLAQNDTIASGIRIPKGTRFLADSFVSNAAMGAGVTLSVGLRNWKTKEVVSATQIASAVAVASAGRSALNNGAGVVDGVEYVTTVDTEVYLTIGGAAPTANAQLRAEISYLNTD